MTDLASPIPIKLLLGAAFSRDVRVMLVKHLLSGIKYGRFTLTLPGGQRIVQDGPEAGPEAEITVHKWRVLRRLVVEGDVGFADAFIAGDWDTPDLSGLLSFWLKNAQVAENFFEGFFLSRLTRLFKHGKNKNSRAGSRRNILAHYDLGNEFYKQWLDEKMIYSSAVYDKAGETLEQAQANKFSRITRMLGFHKKDSVLEIGCGWGGLANHMASKGAQVTGVTISPSQLALAQEAVKQHGFSDWVDLRLQDYRDIAGKFDRIVSIEMFEAVGEAYWATYFQTISRLMKVGGNAVLQVITIADERFEAYRRNPDFIQTHVFPGGMLPSKAKLKEVAAQCGLKLVGDDCFGQSYARTLAEWRNRFLQAWPRIAPLGYSEEFKRLWLYYLSYCEAGFSAGFIDVGLYKFEPAQA